VVFFRETSTFATPKKIPKKNPGNTSRELKYPVER
jgi:hypothetical protein